MLQSLQYDASSFSVAALDSRSPRLRTLVRYGPPLIFEAGTRRGLGRGSRGRQAEGSSPRGGSTVVPERRFGARRSKALPERRAAARRQRVPQEETRPSLERADFGSARARFEDTDSRSLSFQQTEQDGRG